MTPRMKENLKWIGIGLVIVGLLAVERKCTEGSWLGADSVWAKEPIVQIEGNSFICQDDGALTEQHVGVALATVNPQGLWTLDYSDGVVGYYMQSAGETCGFQLEGQPGI